MALWGNSDTAGNKPKFVGNSESTSSSGDSGDATKVYGVDAAEQAAEGDQGTPVDHTGWVRRTTGTGGRAGRTFTEVLVAGSMTGDAEDVVMQDLNINITTQPADDSSASGSAVTFAVVASTIPSGGTLSYQWQLDSGSGFGNISNGGVYSDATTATLAISDNTGLDGNEYRCVVSATGATDVTSDAATLTEAP